ncbi:MAG: hypothetical protein AB1454_00150 [Candidatus Auribacterota bacterium]
MKSKHLVYVLTALFIFSAVSAYAGGDQNKIRHKGDKGQGSVVQNQNR